MPDKVRPLTEAIISPKAWAIKLWQKLLKNPMVKLLMQKLEVKKNELKNENPILSLVKRIAKVEQLNVVIDKWRKLHEEKKNLLNL